MKKSILILPFLLINTVIFAQNTSNQFPINISYYGHFAYQPGLKIGTTYIFKEWKGEEKVSQLTVNPQVGFYFFPEMSTNFVINTEIGYRRQHLDKPRYSTFSIGLGYMAEFQFIGFSTNIGNGNTTKKDRELHHLFMPTINYEFANQFNKRLDWFLKLSVGTKLSTQQESNAVLFTEVGVKYYLK